jgi:hypothetical protein
LRPLVIGNTHEIKPYVHISGNTEMCVRKEISTGFMLLKEQNRKDNNIESMPAKYVNTF